MSRPRISLLTSCVRAETGVRPLVEDIAPTRGEVTPPTDGTAPLATVETLKRTFGVIAVLYTIATTAYLATADRTATAVSLANWGALPLGIMVILTSALIARGHLRHRAPTAPIWILIAAAALFNLAGTAAWNLHLSPDTGRALTLADGLFFAQYVAFTVAYALTYQRFGGRLSHPRTWLDALAIFGALFGVLWATLISALLPPASGAALTPAYVLGYTVVTLTTLTMGALLVMQLPPFPERPRPYLFVLAGLTAAMWDLGWMANRVSHLHAYRLLFNLGDVLMFTALAIAAAFTPAMPLGRPPSAPPERVLYSFLPTVATLIATALLATSWSGASVVNGWLLVVLVIVIGALLVTRQLTLRREFLRLNQALAERVADEKLTELVRFSPDAFLLVSGAGTVTFASAATTVLLGIPPERVVGKPASILLGEGHEREVGEFIGALARNPSMVSDLEVQTTTGTGRPRVLRLVGANRTEVPTINGITLTIGDISEQRALERDILEVANKERLRLAGDIHDGLGQELTGISMLLAGATSRLAPPAPVREQFDTINRLVREAIQHARDLAHGLSPLYVLGGSLRTALQRLATDGSTDPQVRVDVDSRFEERSIDGYTTDHLLRIAQEAVHNALRHSQGTRVDVTLRLGGGELVLAVEDDGVGLGERDAGPAGIGLRLMQYRSRLIGARLEVTGTASGGTLVRLRLPRLRAGD